MGRVTVYNDTFTNCTAVSNCFIDYYMKDANDAQLKVYLYLLRVLGAGMSTSVPDIADKFNHTEKDVMRALQYWEKAQLLSLDFDETGSLSGIQLLPTKSGSTSGKEDSGREIFLSQAAPVTSNESPSLAPVVPIGSRSEENRFKKPNYTLDQLKEFKNRQDIAQLLFITEQYIGKVLSPSEIKSIFFMYDTLGFSEDLIDYLLQYCVGRGKKDFRYIEKVAVSWAEAHVTTPQEAEAQSSRYEKNVYTIMNALGRNSAPTASEADFINRWTKEYGFSEDIILEACERTVLATDKHRFEYAESILSSWKKQNVHHKSDILHIDAAFQKKKTTSKPASSNRFNQFPQNQYDFDALEQEILSN